MSKTAGRVLLPPNINPIRYDLKFTPDFENFTFVGDTTIEVETTSSDVGKSIKMHAKELCFASASYKVKGGDGTEHEVEEIRVNPKETTVTFVFGGELPVSATLILSIQVSKCVVVIVWHLYVLSHFNWF